MPPQYSDSAQSKLQAIISKLPLTMESEHFLIRYGLRNPPQGKGLGASGIQDRGLLLTYVKALERLHKTMTESPWNRPFPQTGDSGKTPIYVFNISELTPFDGSPFTDTDLNDVPFICLPSRSFEPSMQDEMHRAAAEAVHEATHVFNYRHRPRYHLHSKPWDWLDEALAVFMETHLIPGNHDHLRFLRNWIEMPEVPLDDWSARYQAGMFIYYLEKCVPGLANKVWVESLLTEDPIKAFSRLLPETTRSGDVFVSHAPDVHDLFASGYCMDSYFLWDHNSASLAPELYVRYGERSVTESFVLRPGQHESSGSQLLDHLACRYFRFYLKGNVTNLQVEVRADKSQTISPLKAELAIVNSELRRERNAIALRPELVETGRPAQILTAEINRISCETTDHVVLVVTNCGTRPTQPNSRIEHDDGRLFEVRVSAS